MVLVPHREAAEEGGGGLLKNCSEIGAKHLEGSLRVCRSSPPSFLSLRVGCASVVQ